jgi:4-hydroxythreonine-4-phosphate dehydrogenase
VIAARAALRGLDFDPPAYAARDSAPALSMLHLAARAPVVPGRLDAANGRHVLALIDRALAGCVAHEFDAMVTAPVQKSVINEAGIAFFRPHRIPRRAHAHAARRHAARGRRSAGRARDDAPRARDVPRAITSEGLEETLRILERTCAGASRSLVRASSSPASIRMPANPGTSGARRSR